MTEHQVLAVKEVAAILKLAEKSVYSMVQGGELPAFKVRGQWRLRKIDFGNWMAEQALRHTKSEGKDQ